MDGGGWPGGGVAAVSQQLWHFHFHFYALVIAGLE